MITIYHNPRCQKSRQALALLNDNGQDIVIKEYLKEPPTKEELRQVIDLLDIKPLQLVRKNEAEFKDHFKGQDLTDEEWIEAMTKYPKLIERPIVITDKKAILGRPPENVLEVL